MPERIVGCRVASTVFDCSVVHLTQNAVTVAQDTLTVDFGVGLIHTATLHLDIVGDGLTLLGGLISISTTSSFLVIIVLVNLSLLFAGLEAGLPQEGLLERLLLVLLYDWAYVILGRLRQHRRPRLRLVECTV